jgi:hypothetical protein
VIASAANGLLGQQQYHQEYAFNNRQFQSSLTIPGSNADYDDEPTTTTLTFHDKRHCHQYIQDHLGLAVVDKKDCT